MTRQRKKIGQDLPSVGDLYKCLVRTDAFLPESARRQHKLSWFMDEVKYNIDPGEIILVLAGHEASRMYSYGYVKILVNEKVLLLHEKQIMHLFQHVVE